MGACSTCARTPSPRLTFSAVSHRLTQPAIPPLAPSLGRTQSYNRVVYLAVQISSFVHGFSSTLVGVDAHRHLAGVQPLLSEASFDAEHSKTRIVVIGQLQRVLDSLRAGELSDAQIALLVRPLALSHSRSESPSPQNVSD